MLTISKALSSGQAQSYHKLEFTSETQNYYKQGDAVRGEWQGQLAARLGLAGEVSPLEFSRLADGKNPSTDDQMVRHRAAMEYKNADGSITKTVEHRAGWDATFSAPKSVSLTALVGGDDRVREAHRAAVTTALEELERYTQARIGGNNPAEATGKFIAAKFEHDTARPVDGYAAPQLHTHAVIFNVTERTDGTTRAVQPQGLFDSQNFATAVYQSELTLRLSQIGYEIEPGRSGAPEIKGYTQEYLDASSPRSRQIREQLEKTGYSGPEAAQIAAHTTRDKKQPLTAEEVLAGHNEMAASFGNQAEQIVADARARAQQQKQQPQQTTRAREAVTFARDSIFEREAVADERAILRDALRRGMGETSYRDIRAEFDERRQGGQFRSVQGMKHDSGRSFTTPETIAAERANIRYVLEGRNAIEPMMTAERAREQASTRSFLNDSQRRVIEEVLNSSDRIHGLQGLAGSGKTTTLQTVREGAETSGYIVEGFAPTSKAAGQLREAGIDAKTLQSFLARGQNHPSADPTNRHLYMLDESSLASTKQMRSFLSKLNPEDRVLVIGDTRQHQGVDAGRPFQQMQDAGMQTSQLDQIMRQNDPELLKAVQLLAKNETAEGINMLAEQGRIVEIQIDRDRIAAIAKDYATNPQNTIIVSPDNRSRQQINEAVRIELRKGAGLAEDGQILRTLTHPLRHDGSRPHLGGAIQRRRRSPVQHWQQGRGNRARQLRNCPVRRCPGKHAHCFFGKRLKCHLRPAPAKRCQCLPRGGAGIRRGRPRPVHRTAQGIWHRQSRLGNRGQPRRRENDLAYGRQVRPHGYTRYNGVSPVRPRLRRHVAQLTRPYRRARSRSHRHRIIAESHQQSSCLRRNLPRVGRCSHLHKRRTESRDPSLARGFKDCCTKRT